MRPTHRTPPGVQRLVTFASIWSLVLVAVAVIISVPPVNTLIHGTHFVVGHAMGSMLGIDSMILWAVLLYVIHELAPERPFTSCRAVAWAFGWINLAMLLLIVLLLAKGWIDGRLRFMGAVAPAPPRLLIYFPHALVILGSALALGILWVNISWTWALLLPARRDRLATRRTE